MISQAPAIFFLFFIFSIPFYSSFSLANHTNFHVGAILDLSSPIGKVVWSCISMALDDFYAINTNYRTRLFLELRDSHEDNVEAALAALDLLQNVTVQAIIGPQKSRQADFVIELGDKAEVPIISFATSPSLSSRTPYFIRAAQNDSTQVKAITAIIQGFKWREVIAIYEDSDYGNGLIPYLIDSFQEIQTRIAYRSVISLSITDDQIHAELYKLMTMPTRVFVVHMTNSLASRFLMKVKEVGMMSNGYAWIITDGLMNVLDSVNSSVIASMQGALGVKPFIKPSTELDHFIPRWKRKFRKENPYIDKVELNIFGLWSYDIVWALAMAAEKISGTESLNNKPRTENNTTRSASGNGRKLLDAIIKTRFKGLSGDFHFVDGQLVSPVFQILNVIGRGDREIGFWTPGCGITRELNTTCDQRSTTAVTNLKGILWPGELMVVPKGWVVPTNGKKLTIGVPIKDGFSEFVRVDRDHDTNRTSTSGYIIDFFKTVMEELPYPVEYEFVPFQKDDGSSAGNYDDMVPFQVYLQRYDAVVGDTTITGNRSLYVDFTLPYTEGGVSMMVPIKYEDRKNAWIFLKPLTQDLWLTSGAFFILTGFVIWVLEHRINDAFRGPPSQHVGMIFWFPFSTMVFAHRERVVSNLTRFVVIVWIFVVLILNSSYTASLSSMLTVQRLRPAVTGIEELKKNGDYVGYQHGSFIPQLLKFLDFNESKLISFNSHEDLNEALSNGSQNGGIAAFFDVMPYIKLFVAKYCDKYTMVGPIHKTEGFGFIFPKGSPLVGDVSRAILNVTRGKLMEIDRAWFKLETTCLGPGNNVISSRLSLRSFRGLLIITGTVSGLALLVFLVIFLYKHKHVLTAPDSENTFRQRLTKMFKQFDKKDLSSYRFKKDIERGRSVEVRDIEASLGIDSISSYTSGNVYLSDVASIDFEDSMPNSPPVEEMTDVRLSD